MLLKYISILFNFQIQRIYVLKITKGDFINKLKENNKLNVLFLGKDSNTFTAKFLPTKGFVVDLLNLKGEIQSEDFNSTQITVNFFGTRLLFLFMIIYSFIYFSAFIVLFKNQLDYIFFFSLLAFYLFTCIVVASELRKRILYFQNVINAF